MAERNDCWSDASQPRSHETKSPSNFATQPNITPKLIKLYPQIGCILNVSTYSKDLILEESSVNWQTPTDMLEKDAGRDLWSFECCQCLSKTYVPLRKDMSILRTFQTIWMISNGEQTGTYLHGKYFTDRSIIVRVAAIHNCSTDDVCSWQVRYFETLRFFPIRAQRNEKKEKKEKNTNLISPFRIFVWLYANLFHSLNLSATAIQKPNDCFFVRNR